MAQPDPSEAIEKHWDTNIRELPVGDRVQIFGATGNMVGEITENPHDGLWLRVKFLKVPENPGLVGTEEQVFFSDVLAVLKET